MDEQVTSPTSSVGDQLRAARTKKKMSLEDVASQTRIPRRHLESIENGAWDQLPAPTYTIGFAKSYASAVGLDRVAIGEQLREEVGGVRATATAPEVFEPADPARAMPKGLVIGAIVAVIAVVLLLSWLNERSLESDDTAAPPAATATQAPPSAAPQVPTPAQAASGPVVLTAAEPVWLQVYEKGGKTLFQGLLNQGQTYAVPQDALAPMLRTGKPEALRITVGTTAAPPVGPAATTVSDVSLLGPSLMHLPQQAAPAQPAQNPPPAATSPLQNSAG